MKNRNHNLAEETLIADQVKLLNNISFNNSDYLDLSSLKTYTIDDEDTLEVDDALSLEYINDGYLLWIHIASTASYIAKDTPIDYQAKRRMSSSYLSSTIEYMLPIELVQNIISIEPNKISRCLSIGVKFDSNHNIISKRLVYSLVQPDYKLTYKEADELIDLRPKEEKDLYILFTLLEKIKLQRIRNGAIEIDEVIGKLKRNSKKIELKLIEKTPARRLISEAMILYGYSIAEYCIENKITIPFRIQDESNRLNLDKHESINKHVRNFILKRRLGRTFNSIDPNVHIGLGLPFYSQATSPIRRFIDYLIHQQIFLFSNKKTLYSRDEVIELITLYDKKYKEIVDITRADDLDSLRSWCIINKSHIVITFLQWANKAKKIAFIYHNGLHITQICKLFCFHVINEGDHISVKYNITQRDSDIMEFISQ